MIPDMVHHLGFTDAMAIIDSGITHHSPSSSLMQHSFLVADLPSDTIVSVSKEDLADTIVKAYVKAAEKEGVLLTKEDLEWIRARIEADLLTKDDLNELRNELSTKVSDLSTTVAVAVAVAVAVVAGGVAWFDLKQGIADLKQGVAGLLNDRGKKGMD
jgi:hypothetical protein